MPFPIWEQPLFEVAACRGRCPPGSVSQIELRNQKNRLEPWKLAENDDNSRHLAAATGKGVLAGIFFKKGYAEEVR